MEADESRNTKSESNLLRSNIMVSVEDHDSSKAQIEREALEGDGGEATDVSLTVEQAIEQLSEKLELQCSLNLPAHAPPLETIVEADGEAGGVSPEQGKEGRQAKGAGKGSNKVVPVVANKCRGKRGSVEENEENISVEESLGTVTTSQETTTSQGLDSRDQSQITRQSTPSPNLLLNRPQVLITSNQRSSPLNPPPHLHTPKQK